MSLVYITYHDENIFSVAEDLSTELRSGQSSKKRSRVKELEKLREMSIVDLPCGKKLLTGSTRSPHRTLGVAEVPLRKPCEYLRKNMGIHWQRRRDHVCPKMPPPVPIPKVGCKCPFLTHKKPPPNFIALNVENVKRAKPKRPQPRYVDTPNGDSHAVFNAGLLPQYVCSKAFGQVPPYLSKQNQTLDGIKRVCEKVQQKEDEKCRSHSQYGFRELTSKERCTILEGLRSNYAEFTKIYQGLSLYCDTLAKRYRKGRLENTLRKLEQDIALLEANPSIFVAEY